MKQDASSTPARLRVRRRFEANRLAEGCQAQAYEQVLPVDRPESALWMPSEAEDKSGTIEPQFAAKGVAR